MYRVVKLVHNNHLVGYRAFDVSVKAVSYDVSCNVVDLLGIDLSDVFETVELRSYNDYLVSEWEIRMQIYSSDISNRLDMVLHVFRDKKLPVPDPSGKLYLHKDGRFN